MKKSYICFMFIFVMLLSGCSNINKILYPNVGKGELYYNRIRSISKQNIDNGEYSDLFMGQQIVKNLSQKSVFDLDKREKTGESLNYLDIKQSTTNNGQLGNWVQSSICSYGFTGVNRDTNKVIYYMVKNINGTSTYSDYLYIMKALTIKYGECTSEIYRKSNGTIVSVISKQSDKTGEENINFFTEAFSNSEITISSRWVMTEYDVKVDFKSPKECTVVYEFKY